MNKNQRQAYAAKHERRMKLFERQLIKPVMKAIDKQIKEAVTDLKNNRVDKIEQVLLNEDMALAVREIYKTVGVYSANKSIREINASVKSFGFNEEFIRSILTFFQSYLLDRAVIPITKTIREFILQEITTGSENGFGSEKIAQNIMDKAPDFILWRSRLIVRTESVKAHNYGQQLAEEKSQWETISEWISANDHRTRHSHRKMDGVKVDPGEKFIVPIIDREGVQKGMDQMTGPGDPTANIANLANCRCTKSKRAKRDKNGRLIPKIPGPIIN